MKADNLRDDWASSSRRVFVLEATREYGPALAQEVRGWIERELGVAYAWPGNVRELEQCVRNVLVRKRYRPVERKPTHAAGLDQALLDRGLGSEALLDRYAALIYRKTQSYVETAPRLGLDRRTVKERAERGARS